jgi:hypothetical protein
MLVVVLVLALVLVMVMVLTVRIDAVFVTGFWVRIAFAGRFGESFWEK